jgi:tRNA (uracil-5-)-methyltransferase TRM9
MYSSIASEFSETRSRNNIWHRVKLFLHKTVLPYSSIADIGCGNGKYLTYMSSNESTFKKVQVVAVDVCKELLEIASERNPEAGCLLSSGTHLPFRDDTFDTVISIAVLHHILTIDQRKRFVEEFYRILSPINGQGLISVWALEQECPEKTLNKWRKIYNDVPGDYIVPWNGKVDRYYHLFTKAELVGLFEDLPGITIVDVVFEKSNWYIHIEKTGPTEPTMV